MMKRNDKSPGLEMQKVAYVGGKRVLEARVRRAMRGVAAEVMGNWGKDGRGREEMAMRALVRWGDEWAWVELLRVLLEGEARRRVEGVLVESVEVVAEVGGSKFEEVVKVAFEAGYRAGVAGEGVRE